MPTTGNHNSMSNLSLGQATEYSQQYNSELLQPVPRALNRTPIGINEQNLPFYGYDEWTGYELSWLNSKGLPQVAIARFTVPVTSTNLIESKSFKLYLNSFNQSRFNDWQQVQTLMQQDLSACAAGPVTVQLYPLAEFAQESISNLPGIHLDSLDISINSYDYNPGLLRQKSGSEIEETLTSDLLKSNCLITNQPDWGSVSIAYKGPQIEHESLLAYLVSFRNHNEFHEQCVERIFQDLMQHCGCLELTVCARYTRRGGLDINPLRSTQKQWPQFRRTVRQ
ncbi:NADPH-dependent 7-cyano-7-deazaguanine reductase QueF [Aliidiomarina minuta]|uniref:NADPH-dependent 7-cyano-7-deazaguanine reductase n=1 Tax=Aliidiomarina minuta TaxID=880057 RepID=A0A432W5R1_9GAMM|nr:NADPH-dependent 7-cyano-7-deazaguanine reductase QueF [Aliidiomarina minuta]RUO25397.1 NADPH-dependent 7-cyano-7-deazaguanine reductase QueF [Aliidiomarina minuta]